MRSFAFRGFFSVLLKLVMAMKMPHLEVPLQFTPLQILREIPRLAVDSSPDGLVRLDGVSYPMLVQYVHRLGAAQAGDLVGPDASDFPWLIVADETTAAARRSLANAGHSYVDSRGFAHLEMPGLYVHIEPARSTSAASPSSDVGRIRLSGKAGVVAQALLLYPGRAWKVFELAEAASVSVGLTHGVLRRLELDRIVVSEGSGPATVRYVRERGALLDLLAEELRDRGVRTLRVFVLSRDPGELASIVSGRLENGGIRHSVTGAAAADIYAPSLTAVPIVDVWLGSEQSLNQALEALGAERAESGHNVTLRQARDDVPLAMSRHVGSVSVANPVRVYVDVLRDPRRGAEQAEQLRAHLEI
jgi:hypothetical protein